MTVVGATTHGPLFVTLLLDELVREDASVSEGSTSEAEEHEN